MKKIDYDFLYKQFENGNEFIDETCFSILGDAKYTECYIGYIPQYAKPYWAGLCDIEGGCEFESAYDLFNTPLYHNKSIKELWDNINIISIAGICVEDWLTANADM